MSDLKAPDVKTTDETIREIAVYWLRYILVVPVGAVGFLAFFGGSLTRAIVASVGILLFVVGGSVLWFWFAQTWPNARAPKFRIACYLMVLGLLFIALALTITPAPDRIDNKIGQSPQDIALGDRFAWIPDPIDQTVTRVAFASGEISTFNLPEVFEAVTNDDRIYVSTLVGSILELDSTTGDLLRTVELPGAAGCMTVVNGSLWLTQPNEGAVTAVDLTTLETNTLEVGGRPVSISAAQDDRSVWVTDTERSQVIGIAVDDGQVINRYQTGQEPVGIFVDRETIWVGNADSDLVTMIDSTTDTTRNFKVAARPTDLAVHDGVLWVLSQADAALTAIAVDSGKLIGFEDIGGEPIKLDLDGEYIWIADQGTGSLVRILMESVN